MIINNPDNIPEEIVRAAIAMMEQEEERKVVEISIRRTENPDEYGITPVFERVPFQRIRRITGYLVGDLGRFNDAKRSEVMDRVKHTT
ncbi:anaerobic ribonucleoside-triphosphate reductase [Evtepia sp.]|uniref:anaerobic ribonucleoside-triphosphate reductase n=1 Tax=Evtepia sp. TaxID=2773933 RepID=UPI0039908B79